MNLGIEVEYMHPARPLSFENGANLRLKETQLTRIDRPGAIDGDGDFSSTLRPDTGEIEPSPDVPPIGRHPAVVRRNGF